jgi:hypothetical protein
MHISLATGSSSVPGSPPTTPAAAAPTLQATTAVQASKAADAALQTFADSTTYSTSIGGKSYSGNVSQSDGLYEISVPNLPGSAVSASSLQGAENALNARIDLLA